MTTALSVDQRKAEWLAARRRHLTSTDSPAILLKLPWAGPIDIFNRKLGLEDEPEASERMEWGSELQVPVANGYARRTGRQVAHVEPFLLAKHPRLHFVASSLDAFQVDAKGRRGLLEIKLSEMDWKDEPPVYYQIQLQHELMVTGMPWGTLACLVRGNKLVHWDTEADLEFHAQLERILTDFWNKLVNHEPPEAGWQHPGANAALQKLYPKDRGTAIKLPDELMAVALEYDQLKEQLAEAQGAADDLQERVDARAARIKAAMQDSAIGMFSDGSGYSWKSHDQKGYEVKPRTVRHFRRVNSQAMAKKVKGA